MGSKQIVLVSTAGFSVLNTGIFWREAKTKRLFSQCSLYYYIHVSVSDLYIFLIGLPILLQENRWTERRNIYIAHRNMNV